MHICPILLLEDICAKRELQKTYQKTCSFWRNSLIGNHVSMWYKKHSKKHAVFEKTPDQEFPISDVSLIGNPLFTRERNTRVHPRSDVITLLILQISYQKTCSFWRYSLIGSPYQRLEADREWYIRIHPWSGIQRLVQGPTGPTMGERVFLQTQLKQTAMSKTFHICTCMKTAACLDLQSHNSETSVSSFGFPWRLASLAITVTPVHVTTSLACKIRLATWALTHFAQASEVAPVLRTASPVECTSRFLNIVKVTCFLKSSSMRLRLSNASERLPLPLPESMLAENKDNTYIYIYMSINCVTCDMWPPEKNT